MALAPEPHQPQGLVALLAAPDAAVIGYHEHQIASDDLWRRPIMGAKIRAEGARKRAAEAVREAGRTAAEAWSLQTEAYGGPAQPSPSIGQCLNGGLGWVEVECKRCKTREPAT